VVLDLGAGQQGAALKTDTIANDYVLADNDIGSDAAVVSDLGTGVDQDISTVDVRLRMGGQELGRLLGQ
jgi:hypothetical protein